MSDGNLSSLSWSRFVAHSALPSGLLSDSELPLAYDWRAVNGLSFVTADTNQHLPQPCASWVHATAAALDDRIKIARRAKGPDIRLSRQALLNCVPAPRASAPPGRSAGGCDGGDASLVHEYLAHSVVPDETCQPYTARNGVCEPVGHCRSCPPSEAGTSASPACLSSAAPSYVGCAHPNPNPNANPDADLHPHPNPDPTQVRRGRARRRAGRAGHDEGDPAARPHRLLARAPHPRPRPRPRPRPHPHPNPNPNPIVCSLVRRPASNPSRDPNRNPEPKP